MNHDSMIAVIAAHRDGKPIQWQLKQNIGGAYDKWHDCDPVDESWNFVVVEYRIKPMSNPRPREFWLLVGLNNHGIDPEFDTGSPPLTDKPGYKFIRVREIPTVLPSSGESV